MVPQKFEDFRDRDIEPETSLGGGDAHGYPFYLWRESADNRLTLGRPRYCCITETPDDLYFTFFNPSVDIRPTGAARVFGWGITISAIIMLFLAWRGNGSTGPYVSNTSAPPFMTVVGTFLFATTFGGIASGSWFAIVTLRRWMADRFKGDGRVEMKPLRCLDGFQVISAHEAGAMKNG